MYEIKKVDNPKYQSMSEIASDYWDNWLVLSNAPENAPGGIVRYYCYSREDELTDIIMEMDKDFDTYGDCMITFVGPNRGWVGGIGL